MQITPFLLESRTETLSSALMRNVIKRMFNVIKKYFHALYFKIKYIKYVHIFRICMLDLVAHYTGGVVVVGSNLGPSRPSYKSKNFIENQCVLTYNRFTNNGIIKSICCHYLYLCVLINIC